MSKPPNFGKRQRVLTLLKENGNSLTLMQSDPSFNTCEVMANAGYLRRVRSDEEGVTYSVGTQELTLGSNADNGVMKLP